MDDEAMTDEQAIANREAAVAEMKGFTPPASGRLEGDPPEGFTPDGKSELVYLGRHGYAPSILIDGHMWIHVGWTKDGRALRAELPDGESEDKFVDANWTDDRAKADPAQTGDDLAESQD